MFGKIKHSFLLIIASESLVQILKMTELKDIKARNSILKTNSMVMLLIKRLTMCTIYSLIRHLVRRNQANFHLTMEQHRLSVTHLT